jgi:hypothetical protein
MGGQLKRILEIGLPGRRTNCFSLGYAAEAERKKRKPVSELVRYEKW